MRWGDWILPGLNALGAFIGCWFASELAAKRRLQDIRQMAEISDGISAKLNRNTAVLQCLSAEAEARMASPRKEERLS